MIAKAQLQYTPRADYLRAVEDLTEAVLINHRLVGGRNICFVTATEGVDSVAVTAEFDSGGRLAPCALLCDESTHKPERHHELDFEVPYGIAERKTLRKCIASILRAAIKEARRAA